MNEQNSNSYPTKPIVGVGAIVQKGGKVLLVKRGVEPSLGLWAVPGGTLKLGESMRHCAERELFEETGVTAQAGECVYTFDFVERDAQGKIKYHFVVVDFAAKYISGEPQGADDALVCARGTEKYCRFQKYTGGAALYRVFNLKSKNCTDCTLTPCMRGRHDNDWEKEA